jgi:hypothetical protein
MLSQKNKNLDLEGLEKSINRAKLIAALVFFLIPISYFLWFWIFQDQSFSQSSGDWGTFGDFVGGVLNPLIAFFAFYWLTQSIKLQRQELGETKDALIKSSEAQNMQVQNQVLANKLLLLDSKLRTCMSDIEFLYSEIQSLSGDTSAKVAFNGQVVSPVKRIPSIQLEISKLKIKRDEYHLEMDYVLREMEDVSSRSVGDFD